MAAFYSRQFQSDKTPTNAAQQICLVLAEQHRDLWSELNRRPELQRIREREIDLVSKPIAPAETEFLNLAFVHFYTGWLLAKRRALPTLEALSADVGGFFSLPLPHSAWKETRQSRDPKFVRFIDECLNKDSGQSRL